MGKVFFLCVTPDKTMRKKKSPMYVDIHSNYLLYFIQFHFPSTSSRHQCVSVCFILYVCSIHELNFNQKLIITIIIMKSTFVWVFVQ